MTASNQIFLVMDAGSPKAAFTTGGELQAHLRRRVDTFTKSLVYRFWGSQGPSIMTMSAALAEYTYKRPPKYATLTISADLAVAY